MKVNSINNSTMNYSKVNNKGQNAQQQAPALQYGGDSVSFSGAKMAMGKRVGLFLTTALVTFGIGFGGRAIYDHNQTQTAIIQEQKDAEQARLDKIAAKEAQHQQKAAAAQNDEKGNLADMYEIEGSIAYKDADALNVNYNLSSLLNAAVGETETKPHRDVTNNELEVIEYALNEYEENASDEGKKAAKEFSTHLDELKELTGELHNDAVSTALNKVTSAEGEVTQAETDFGTDSIQHSGAQQRLTDEQVSFDAFKAEVEEKKATRPISFEAVMLDTVGEGKYQHTITNN